MFFFKVVEKKFERNQKFLKYIGCIGINESMKSLSFEIRTQLARESIRRVAESAKLLIMPRKTRKVNFKFIFFKVLTNVFIE